MIGRVRRQRDAPHEPSVTQPYAAPVRMPNQRHTSAGWPACRCGSGPTSLLDTRVGPKINFGVVLSRNPRYPAACKGPLWTRAMEWLRKRRDRLDYLLLRSPKRGSVVELTPKVLAMSLYRAGRRGSRVPVPRTGPDMPRIHISFLPSFQWLPWPHHPHTPK